MQCKYCGKEYKTEAFLLKHESECTSKTSADEEVVSSGQVIEEIGYTKNLFDPNSVEEYRKDLKKLVKESNKDSKFTYVSLRNFKR